MCVYVYQKDNKFIKSKFVNQALHVKRIYMHSLPKAKHAAIKWEKNRETLLLLILNAAGKWKMC